MRVGVGGRGLRPGARHPVRGAQGSATCLVSPFSLSQIPHVADLLDGADDRTSAPGPLFLPCCSASLAFAFQNIRILQVVHSLVHSKISQPTGFDGEVQGSSLEGRRSRSCSGSNLRVRVIKTDAFFSISIFAGLPLWTRGGAAGIRQWAPVGARGRGTSWSQRGWGCVLRRGASSLPGLPRREVHVHHGHVVF